MPHGESYEARTFFGRVNVGERSTDLGSDATFLFFFFINRACIRMSKDSFSCLLGGQAIRGSFL